MATINSADLLLSLYSYTASFFFNGGTAGGGSYSGSDGSGFSSGSGSGLSSGSGSGEEGYVGVGGTDVGAECVDDLSRENHEGQELTSSTAYTALVCSLLCMENITSYKVVEVVM